MKAARKSARSTEHVDVETLAEQLAPRVAALVLARIATALGACEMPFSTRRGYAPPEFVGRPRVWRETAPTIPGAVQIGRWVSVPRAAYATWLAARSIAGATPAAVAPAVMSSAQPRTPADVARALGFRLVGDGGGRQ